MVKSSTTYTTLLCIVNHNTYSRLVLFYEYINTSQGSVATHFSFLNRSAFGLQSVTLPFFLDTLYIIKLFWVASRLLVSDMRRGCNSAHQLIKLFFFDNLDHLSI